MIVLDTNVISEITKSAPDRKVLEWFAGSPEDDIYLCDTVLMEQSYGAERFWLKAGSRRYYETFERLLVVYNGRVLPFDRGASIETGQAACAARKHRPSDQPAGRHDRRYLPCPRRNTCHPQRKRFRGA